MQQVINGDDKLTVPTGWGILKPGTKIRKGDKYYNLDKKQWAACSAADATTFVTTVPDVVIREQGGDATVFCDDYNYSPEIVEEMIS